MSTATLIGQILSLLLLALFVYLIALVPISLKKIAGHLAEIKDELRKQNNRRGSHEA